MLVNHEPAASRLSPVERGVTLPCGFAWLVWWAWGTAVAFLGGRIPLTGVEVAGGFWAGLLWLVGLGLVARFLYLFTGSIVLRIVTWEFQFGAGPQPVRRLLGLALRLAWGAWWIWMFLLLLRGAPLPVLGLRLPASLLFAALWLTLGGWLVVGAAYASNVLLQVGLSSALLAGRWLRR